MKVIRGELFWERQMSYFFSTLLWHSKSPKRTKTFVLREYFDLEISWATLCQSADRHIEASKWRSPKMRHLLRSLLLSLPRCLNLQKVPLKTMTRVPSFWEIYPFDRFCTHFFCKLHLEGLGTSTLYFTQSCSIFRSRSLFSQDVATTSYHE